MPENGKNHENPLKLLLVDDEAGYVSVLSKRMAKRNFDVITATNGIEAIQTSAELSYERRDYRWVGLASFKYSDFTVSNQRNSLYATTGFAYEMRAYREQRLFLEWAQSRNSLDGAVYFNPAQDISIGLVHRTDFVYDSRYRRHVDHLWLSVNSYNQEGFGTHGRWALRYEQNYDFDEARALAFGAGVARNIYDGKYETETRVYLNYHQRF